MTSTLRVADHEIEPSFLERWSPRAFDGSEVPVEDLMRMLEAARWAPSSFNVQPWRFVYARRGTEHWPRLLELLVPFNRSWAKDAGALIFIVSDTMMPAQGGGEARPSHSHSFDAGAGWMALALQAHALGYHTHGMTGVDFDAARTALAVPDQFRIEAAIAIGRRGDPSILPEGLQAREVPSPRRPLAESIHEGGFPAGA